MTALFSYLKYGCYIAPNFSHNFEGWRTIHMRNRLNLFVGALLVTMFWSWIALGASQVTGAGGTAIYPVLSKWAESYKQQTNTEVNYQAIGSGGGIAQI